MKNILLYAVTTLIFFAIDIVWLGFVAKSFYRKYLGFILSPEVNWIAAIVFYLIYILGIIYFAINPALKNQSAHTALFQGAALGFLCYATYDLTNMATIKGWPLVIVVVDIIWGTVLTGSCAWVTYQLASRWIS